MFTNHIKFFLAVPIFVIAMLCAPNIATAIPISDTFTDIIGQGQDPGDIALIDEHGSGTLFSDNDEGVLMTWSYSYGVNLDLRVNISNTSSHTMWNTVLAFEQDLIFGSIVFPDWMGTVLALNTWDGTDSNGDAAYWFGDIASGSTSWIVIDVRNGETTFAPLGLIYNSVGLNSSEVNPFEPFSNVSITHGAVVPEPASLILFIVAGGAMLAGRKYFIGK